MGNPEHIVVDADHKGSVRVRVREFGRFGLPDEEVPEVRSLLVECGFHGDGSSRDAAHDMCARLLVGSEVLSPAQVDTVLPGWTPPLVILG